LSPLENGGRARQIVGALSRVPWRSSRGRVGLP